jgi:hypothetical protein
VKASMENPTWAQLIQEAYNRDLNLTAQHTYTQINFEEAIFCTHCILV